MLHPFGTERIKVLPHLCPTLYWPMDVHLIYIFINLFHPFMAVDSIPLINKKFGQFREGKEQIDGKAH